MSHSQIADVKMMRVDLKKHFGIADYLPFRGLEPLRSDDGLPRGEHSGRD